jgi:3-deoxy-D-manno-octulosonate 8-phosphate phosphatase (KDO 8-P phosphatase)
MGQTQRERAGPDLAARCAPIELLMADVDGVLTDGVIAIDAEGEEIKHFHVRDGLGYAMWHRAGKRSAILSGRRAAAVESRAAELSIGDVLQGHDAKAGPFRDLIGWLGLEPRQVCYVGDDLPDLPVLRAVGLAACPADAVAEVREAAHLVTSATGGRGAVREIIEVILKAQGKWSTVNSR